MPAGALAFADALMKTGYMFPLISGTQLVASAAPGKPLRAIGLALIAPIIVGIVTFHAFLAPSGAAWASSFWFWNYLAWSYRNAFRPMLAMRTKPA